MTNRIGFVGGGKLGVSLAHYLKNKGLCISGFYDTVSEAVRFASEMTETVRFDSLAALLEASDTLFVTVPDGVIGSVWEKCCQNEIAGKYFFHCSGVMSSDIFRDSGRMGVYACSAHPLCAVRSREDSGVFSGKFFVVEGDVEGLDMLKSILRKTNNPICVIQSADKPKYHAAAATASNLFCALAQMSENLLQACGFDEAAAHELLAPLMLGNVNNIAQKGCVGALTGPVERNDVATIAKHLSVLENHERDIYRLLSLRLLDMARQKHPERDYSNMLELLQK